MTDLTGDKPVISISSDIKNGDLRLLVAGEPGEGCDSYDLGELQDFTLKLMQWAHVSYDAPILDEQDDKKTLADFSDEERKLYYPFAFVLACLAGNAFRTGQLNSILENGDKIAPSEETISAYIPDAYRIIKANSGDLEEVRQLIQNAAK